MGLVPIFASAAALAAPVSPHTARSPLPGIEPTGPPTAALAPSSTSTPARTDVPTEPRFYVVGPPRDDQREYLYQIAVQTLGDGNRYREIFALNRDRQQPDGSRLTDPLTALQPGWILELPADAAGPAVRVGPLPTASPAQPDRAAGTGDGTSAIPYLVGAVGLVMMAALLAVALRRLGRDRQPSVGRRGTATSQNVEEITSTQDGRQPTEKLAGATTGTDAAPEVAALDVVAERPATLLTRSGRLVVELEPLTGAPDQLDVRLLGTALEVTADTACAWLVDEQLPEATLPVVLGRQGDRRLFVDLAAAPDVFTVTGVPSAARRLALTLAEQLAGSGVTVGIVGDALGPDVPAGYRRMATFPTADGDLDAPAGPGVVFSGGLRGADLTAARDLAVRTGHRVIAVLVGEVVRSRWSVRVTEPKG
ncbi:hypothetical protein ACWDV4_29000 [Micromonospora sp. NPDC003197]